jgi:hypothetical protein
MPNERGSPELHVMVHRGVNDFNPNAEGKNMLKVNNTHVQTSTDSVHSLYPSAAHEFSSSGDPAAEPDFPKEGKALDKKYYNFDPAKKDPRAIPDHLHSEDKTKEREEWTKKPEFQQYLKEQDKMKQRLKTIKSDWQKGRHAAGKDGVLSFWVPISKFNGHGGYKTGDPQAEDQAHVNIAPGKFQRVKQSEMKELHSKSKPPKKNTFHEREQLLTPDTRYLYPKE